VKGTAKEASRALPGGGARRGVRVEGDRRINKKEVSEDKNASQRHWALQQRLRGRGAVGMHRLLCQRGGDAGERGAAAARGATTTTSPNLN
jgi:hypothetical protein